MAKAQSSFAEKEMAAYGKERGCTQRVLLNQSIYELVEIHTALIYAEIHLACINTN